MMELKKKKFSSSFRILSASWTRNSFLAVFAVALFSCGGGGDVKGPSPKVNMASYVHGKEIYKQRCQNCHQEDGQGFASLYPPLANSDYLMADQLRAARIVKFGSNEEIVVNGKTYNQAMPHNEIMIDQDIADVLTYVYNTWGNNGGTYTVEKVKEALGREE